LMICVPAASKNHVAGTLAIVRRNRVEHPRLHGKGENTDAAMPVLSLVALHALFGRSENVIKLYRRIHKVVDPILVVGRVFLIPKDSGNTMFTAIPKDVQKIGAIFLGEVGGRIDPALPRTPLRVFARPRRLTQEQFRLVTFKLFAPVAWFDRNGYTFILEAVEGKLVQDCCDPDLPCRTPT